MLAYRALTHSSGFSANQQRRAVQTFAVSLANSNYTYSNAQYTLKFTIVDNGWSIKNTTLTNKSSGQVETQKGGEFMKGGWYQFQTALCNYSFDDPKNALKLSKYDCKDKSVKDTSIDLKKNW